MSKLFASDGPRLYTMPPGVDFLTKLAEGLITALDPASNPQRLADILIYVPNARSARGLAAALLKASGLPALMMPDIRALGNLEQDEPPASAEAALADLPPAISSAHRIGELTKLVIQYFKAHELDQPATSALAAARELARLLDQAALSSTNESGVDWAALETLVTDHELSRHWEHSLEFLKIITQQWPARLENAKAMDPYARRYAAAEAVAMAWGETPPDTPVILAGSTGATLASRLLMKAVLQLPKGLVVLPGLDQGLPEAARKSLAMVPSHPQHALIGALDSLDLKPADVPEWPGHASSVNLSARQKLIHETLAPADQTADWTQRLATLAPEGDSAAFVSSALSGLSLIEAADDMDEAGIAALLMRETLERAGETAALVTPDAGLAEQVSARLKHWGVDVSPSAGQPLSQSPMGALTVLAMDWLVEPSHPVRLMAMLGHELVHYDRGLVLWIDKHILRGPRAWNDWPGLRTYIDGLFDAEQRALPAHQRPAVNALFDALEAFCLDPDEAVSGNDVLPHLTRVLEHLTQTPGPWAGESGGALSTLLETLSDLTEALGLLPLSTHAELLANEAAMARISSGSAHPRLAIYGPLEARLQAADHIILGGLNEGVWPAQPAPDMFLPRIFRRQIGIADPDTRIGLSAHDYAQLACAPQVTLLTSKRREDKPAVASRWIWRLKTLVAGALGDEAETALAPPADADPRDWLQALETPPEAPTIDTRPLPRPAVEHRPTRFSVSRIEDLIRDPYKIYCQYILRLYPLERLNLPADARLRGSAIHKALEDFEQDGTPKTADHLTTLIEEQLRMGGEADADIIALRERRRQTVEDYLSWRAETAHKIAGDVITEEKGRYTFTLGGREYALEGTADRIEKRHDGTIAILDFKTGKPPSEPQVRAGLSPQMPLQGLIAREGGYDRLGAREVDALTYIRFGTQFDVREIGEENGRGSSKLEPASVADIIKDAEDGLIKLLTAFANPDEPYRSQPKPERVNYASDYARLARRDEWEGEQ
jgi:ATP-dependent helicase/nuclease subunit B